MQHYPVWLTLPCPILALLPLFSPSRYSHGHFHFTVLRGWSHGLDLPNSSLPWGWYCIRFLDEETEALRREATCPKSYTLWEIMLRSEPRYSKYICLCQQILLPDSASSDTDLTFTPSCHLAMTGVSCHTGYCTIGSESSFLSPQIHFVYMDFVYSP
jgi:hypothetical protein